MAKIKGNDLILFIQKDDKYKAYAYSTTCEIDIQADTIEVGSPDTGQWVKKKKRKKNWRLSSGYLMSDSRDFPELFQMLIENNEISVLLGTVKTHMMTVNARDYIPDELLMIKGVGMINRMTVTGRKGDFVTMSVEIEGNGELNVSIKEYVLLYPNTIEVSYNSSSCVINVKSNASWSFDVTAGEEFISYDGTNEKEGDDVVVINILENSDIFSRIGKIKFMTKGGDESYLTIVQKAPDILNISPDTIQDIPKNGGNYDIFITSSGNWTCIDTPLWAVPNIYTGEVGKAIVNIDVEMNESGSERSGVMTFKLDDDDKVSTLVIKQLAQDDYIIIDPNPINIPKDTYSDIINVIASGSWRITSNPSWVDIAPSDGMEGHNNVSIDITANVGNTRTGRIEFALDDKPDTVGTLIIKQEGNEPLVITPDTIHGIPASGGSYEVTIKATGNWTCSYNPTWARPDNGLGTAGETTFTLDVEPNAGNSRGDRLEFELDDTGYVVELDVLQDAATSINGISLEPPFPSELFGSAYSGGEYEVVSENDWFNSLAKNIEMNPTSGLAGRTYVDFKVSENNNSPRVVILELGDETTGETYAFGCIQQSTTGASKEIMADIAGFPNIPKAGGLYSAYLVSLKDWIYDEDSSNNTSWLTVRQKSGIAGITEVSVIASQNQTSLERLATLRFTTADGTDYVLIGVHQLG